VLLHLLPTAKSPSARSDLFGHKVRLVSLRALHPLLQHPVLAEARPVYAA
jgi:hypothetical protein